MSVLLSKPWWQIILIMIITLGGLSAFLWFVVYTLKLNIKAGNFAINNNDLEKKPTMHPDYIEFCQATRELMILLKNDFRAWCVDNGMAKMDETRFSLYKQTKCEYISQFSAKFILESCATLQIATVQDIKENFSDLKDILLKHVNNLLDTVRGISIEQEVLIEKKRKALDEYIKTESESLENRSNKKSLVPIFLQAGHMMVEMHELGNRELVRKQMAKLEEQGLVLYNMVAMKYLGLLTKKLSDK